MFKNAKWISKCNHSSIDELAPAPMFRKKFFVGGDIKSAVLYVCGLGLGDYYLNGKSISDEVLTTPFTKYDSTVLYNTFDVTEFINQGENVIGAILGNGCYFVHEYRWDVYKPPWNSYPKLIANLCITYQDGTIESIISDKSWKTSNSPIVYNQTKIGEIYDARLEQSGWSDVGFDDSEWDNVFISRPPGGVLKKMEHPPIRVCEEYQAVKLNDGVYDIEQNISGWVKMRVRGEKGSKIVIKYAECLKQNGMPDVERLNTIVGSYTHSDTYILKGDGVETYAPRFVYHGFRYFSIEGDVQLIDAVGQFVHTDFDEISEFVSDDDVLNKLHHMTKMATLSNCMGLPTDCPQREQNAWTGDALISANQTFMNYDIKSFYLKWLGDIADQQRPSGQVCCINPTGGWGFEWGTGPAFDGVIVLLPYLIYKFTGDKTGIEKMWDNMERYMDFVISMSDEFIVDYGLADWRAPFKNEICPSEITDTAYFYASAVVMEKSALCIGQNAEKYSELAENIKSAFRKKFMKNGLLINETQTATACAAYHGLLTEKECVENIKILVQRIEQCGYHFRTGIYGTKCIFDVLADYGYNDVLYKMVTNTEMPGYGYWVENGMTTLCECWNMEGSLNHHMFSEVDMWLFKHLGGIHIHEGEVMIIPEKFSVPKTIDIKYYDVKVHRCGDYIKIETKRPVKILLNGNIYNITSNFEQKLSW